MRFLAFLLLLPMLASAQPPAQQMDPQQFFEQTKQMMLPMMQETLPAMREARSCLQAADDQAAFEDCAEIMVELDKKMRARVGPAHGMQGAEAPPMKDPKEIEWNAETKKNMLQYLDHSITIGSAMSDCLNQSGTVEQMQQCMQSKRPTP
ncbi:MAG: hypothetical protein P8103_12610 [Candidatus Thiodiazotropha sp.]